MIRYLASRIPVSFLCDFFGVSRSGYYRWYDRPQSKRHHSIETNRLAVRNAFKANYGRYGSPRVWAYLVKNNYPISLNTVVKIMNEESLIARSRKRFKVVKDDEHPQTGVAERVFKIEEKKELEFNEIWVGDITYIPINNKFLYLSAVMDLKRRKIVGWSLDDTLGSSGVIKAFRNARENEGISGCVFHSDQGLQYKSKAFREMLERSGTTASMSRKRN